MSGASCPRTKDLRFAFLATVARWLVLCAVLLTSGFAVSGAHAQGPLPGVASGEESAEQKAAAAKPDPYGRDSPRGLASGLVAAFASGDYGRAAQYLEPAAGQKTTDPDARSALAKKLQRQLDSGGTLLPFPALSNAPDGALDDSLAVDEERIGSFKSKSGEIPLIARRLSPEDAKPHWVLSSESLKAVVEHASQADAPAITDVLPKALNDTRVAGAPIADWLVLMALAAVAFLGMRFAFALVLKGLHAIVRDPDTHRGYQFADTAFPPASLYLAVIALFVGTQQLQVAIVARQVVVRYATIFGWIAFVWFLWRLIDMVSDLWAARMARNDRRRAMSALVFVRRSAKALLAIVAFVAVLDTLGINVTTSIAALGLGGLAFALGAQKTIENLIGSIAVILDQPVRVGDFCRVGDVLGTVEDVGMRSTQIRTNARTVVTIPNSNFSSQQIENFSRRDRFLLNPVIGLTYDVSATAMRSALEAIRAVLDEDDNVIDGARVRFVGFNSSSLDIEIFAYIRTFDYVEFLRLREEVLLKIMDSIAAEGASIAFPTQTIVLKSP